MVFAVARGGPGPVSLAYRRTIASLHPSLPTSQSAQFGLEQQPCRPILKLYADGAVVGGANRTFATIRAQQQKLSSAIKPTPVGVRRPNSNPGPAFSEDRSKSRKTKAKRKPKIHIAATALGDAGSASGGNIEPIGTKGELRLRPNPV